MANWTKTMTIGEFVEWLKKGANWWKDTIPRRIGQFLDEVVPSEDRDREVTIKYKSGSQGQAPFNFFYYFRWEVKGYRLPVDFWQDNIADIVIRNTDDGFEISARS